MRKALLAATLTVSLLASFTIGPAWPRAFTGVQIPVASPHDCFEHPCSGGHGRLCNVESPLRSSLHLHKRGFDADLCPISRDLRTRPFPIYHSSLPASEAARFYHLRYSTARSNPSRRGPSRRDTARCDTARHDSSGRATGGSGWRRTAGPNTALIPMRKALLAATLIRCPV